jgi:hypothetical protein
MPQRANGAKLRRNLKKSRADDRKCRFVFRSETRRSA